MLIYSFTHSTNSFEYLYLKDTTIFSAWSVIDIVERLAKTHHAHNSDRSRSFKNKHRKKKLLGVRMWELEKRKESRKAEIEQTFITFSLDLMLTDHTRHSSKSCHL